MEAVVTTDAFRNAAVAKAIEAAAMRKAYATCDTSRIASERGRIDMLNGWEQEKKNTVFYQEQSKRRGPWVWVGKGAVVAIVVKIGVEVVKFLKPKP